MRNRYGLSSDLLVDVHADAYVGVTWLSQRRWRIGVMIQPRQAAAEHWWVASGGVDLQLSTPQQVTAVAAAVDVGIVRGPSVHVPNDLAKRMGYGEQTHASARVDLAGGLTYARFEFSVDPDVAPMVVLGGLDFHQSFDGRELYDAAEFRTTIPFGTDEHRRVVLGRPRQEVWCTDEVLEPGESASVYWVHEVHPRAGNAMPCGHDWCNGHGVIE